MLNPFTKKKLDIEATTLNQLGNFLEEQDNHSAKLSSLENELLELAREQRYWTSPRDWRQIIEENIPKAELSQKIIQIIETAHAEESTNFADIRTGDTQTPWLERIGNLLKIARATGNVEAKSNISIETVVQYLQAQEMLKTTPVREITNDPILSRIDTNPTLPPNPKFYEIRTANYSLILGHKGSQLLLHQEECQPNYRHDFNEIIELMAECKIRMHAGVPIYTYSPCSSITIPRATQTTIYKVNAFEQTIREEATTIRLGGNYNQKTIEINQHINALKQLEPGTILLLMETLYLPKGLNTETNVGIFNHPQPDRLEVSSLPRNEEPIARARTTTGEVEHKTEDNTWVSTWSIMEAVRDIIKGKSTSQEIPITTTLRETIGHIAGNKSGEVIYVNLTNKKNPIQRVLGLNLINSPKTSRARARKQYDAGNGADR